MTQPNVLLLLDREDSGGPFHGYLKRLQYPSERCSSARAVWERLNQGLSDVDVVLIHKDLGVHNDSDWGSGVTSDVVVRRIHEEASHIRIGVVSGEYPEGEKHVLQMGADFYCSPLEMIDFAIVQIQKGTVGPKEQLSRGKSVEMPPNNSPWFMKR